MPGRRQRYLSGLGDAEGDVLGAKEDDTSWSDVLDTAAAALPGLIDKVPGVIHAYESHGGGAAGVRAVIPLFSQPEAREPEESPASAPAPVHAEPEAQAEWYESPGFLVVTGLAFGLLVAVVRKEK